jgi:hypothetical protein
MPGTDVTIEALTALAGLLALVSVLASKVSGRLGVYVPAAGPCAADEHAADAASGLVDPTPGGYKEGA